MDFESQQDKFSSLSDGFTWWISKYGYTGLMKEYYNNTFENGFNEEQCNLKEEIRSDHLLNISDDGYLTTSSGNRVVVNRSLQRDSHIFIITEDKAYGPFGFYVEIRKKSKTMANRLLFKHNNKEFKQMTLSVLMEVYRISDDDIFRWSTREEIEWILRDEKHSGKAPSTNSQQPGNNKKLIGNARFHNINIKRFDITRPDMFIQELARFICFCLESLFSEEDDRDHISKKLVRQRIFYLEPDMKREKKVTIMKKFREGLESMSDFYYNNVSDRNQVDIWSSARKLILSKEQHVEFRARTLHYSHKKFICPVETPHDANAGLHVTLACLSVVSPPPLFASRHLMETLVLSFISNPTRTSIPIFYNGHYVGKTSIPTSSSTSFSTSFSKHMKEILHKVKDIDEFASVYFKSKPLSVRGIYISNYGGRILRWSMKGNNFKDGMFVCPNMEVRGETTDANFFLGFAASLVPLIHHNAGPRGVFMANMMKQTLDPDDKIAVGNGKRWMKHDAAILLTLTSKALKRERYGINMLVKWASYKGLNIEDGIVINRRLLEEDHGIVYNKFTTEIAPHEYLVPILDNNTSINETDSASFFDNYDTNGVIKEGVTINNKQILATKYKVENKKFINKVTLKALVDNPSVIRKVTKQGKNLNIITSYKYKLKMGDKLVSSAAQKGVITHVVEEDERADIIINPCCIPSRMTLAQIWEGVICNYHKDNNLTKPLFFPPFSNAVELFCNMTGNNFNDITDNFNSITDKFNNMTGNFNGITDNFNGITDNSPLDNLIPKGKEDYWYCWNRYYVLGHRVDEKFRVRGEGDKTNTNLHTAQPQKGRKVGGGLRLGVMERDVLISHNSIKTLKYLFSKHGDEIECYYCPGCLSFCHTVTCYLCKISECEPLQINKSEINFKNLIKIAGVVIKQEPQDEGLEDLYASDYAIDSPNYAPSSPDIDGYF